MCLEFPRLSWLAKNPEAAPSGIPRVVTEAVQDMENRGELPPSHISGKSYSGKFIVRIPPEVHRALAIKAAEQGISLNRLISARLAGS